MSNEYRNNHYVPRWYQKKFLQPGQINQELYYLNLKPDIFRDSRGVAHPGRALRKQGLSKCFAETDLYTTRFGEDYSTQIEKYFFGDIDREGRGAVGYFANFVHPSADGDAFRKLVRYMSTQRLRTPKGMDWLANQANATDRDSILRLVLTFGNLHGAIWTECAWLIADASSSDTKFIVSDNPVTFYNRRCGPHSQWCRDSNDPDFRFHATHTIFPLSLDKVLILTNLSWVRNPYQSEVKLRPNPNPLRDSIFKFTDIQTLRHLSEQEVREINFIIKSRAYRYIGAAKEEWLYPEKYVSKSDWSNFGNGYLLMPDPRGISLTGEIIIGYKDGSATSFDEYGRRPWQQIPNRENQIKSEFSSLHRFKGEFARLFGPFRRGRSFEMMSLDNERDSEELHQYHLSLEKRGKANRKR